MPPSARYHSYGRTEDAGDFRTLIRTFRHPRTGDTVTLMGMVHLADESFYARANAEIRKADLVLMEGVHGTPGLGALPLLYDSGLAARITAPARLAHQGEMLPADAPQCENADVAISEISPGFGATLFGVATLPVRVVIGESAVVLQTFGDYGAALVGKRGDYSAWHRATLAKQLGEADADDLGDADLIIGKRNGTLLDHLDKHIAKGKPGRTLIPWGAAHGPGLEKGLRDRGYEAVSDEWVVAIGVRSYEESGHTTPAHPYGVHVPLLFSVRGSDTTLSHSGPLWIWSRTRAPAGEDTSVGWILCSDMRTAKGESRSALLGGLLRMKQETPDESDALTLLGLVGMNETDKKTGVSQTYAALGLYGEETSPEHSRVRLGWWGSLFSHERHEDGYQTTSVLPHVFGRPLLYDSKTIGGVTRRRALLFLSW